MEWVGVVTGHKVAPAWFVTFTHTHTHTRAIERFSPHGRAVEIALRAGEVTVRATVVLRVIRLCIHLFHVVQIATTTVQCLNFDEQISNAM